MYRVDVYLRVRRAVMVEGKSIREVSREFGLHRDTVRKMLAYSAPPGYRRQTPPRRPKLEPFTGVIDRILEDDLGRPRKQRHTAKRIFERLRDEYGFDVGYTIVKDYVRENRRQTREMFVPLSHPPGHAQCDFGEALVVIGGVEQKAHCFVIDLPHSDGCFVKAYPAETTEAFLDGHVSAFAYLGGVPQSILYDNTRLAVAKILNDSTLFAPGGVEDDKFRYSVAVDGDTAVIGAYQDDDNSQDSGAAYIFTRSAGVWSQTVKLTASDGGAYDNFGISVAVDGDTVVIGASGDDDNGVDSGSDGDKRTRGQGGLARVIIPPAGDGAVAVHDFLFAQKLVHELASLGLNALNELDLF